MLILAALSGIQDFVFDVRESGGGQARSLRFRSFRVQLYAEIVALRLLLAAGLGRDRLLYCASAKACIDALGIDVAALARVRKLGAELERALFRETHGRLRLSLVECPTGGAFVDSFDAAGRALRQAKHQAFRMGAAESAGWESGALVADAIWAADREADADADLGRQLASAKYLSMHALGNGRLTEGGLCMLGTLVRFHERDWRSNGESAPISVSSLERPEERPAGVEAAVFHPRRLARHVPRLNGRNLEFLELAGRARGAPMLAVIKADVDDLGRALSAEVERAGGDPKRSLRDLSEALDRFFGETLEQEKQREPWSSIYSVFSGGDDMLAVGPWNVVLDFAAHARALFDRSFGPSAPKPRFARALTLSAGVAIIKPRFPVHLAAEQAESLLHAAKSLRAPGAQGAKDQCAAFGQVWKWEHHARVVEDAVRLADWVEGGKVQRGWLHTLLELTHLRRGEAGPEYRGVPPAVATSRLAYHAARNWKDKDARDWIFKVLDEFDSPLDERPERWAYMPAILRYALLATRSSSSEDSP